MGPTSGCIWWGVDRVTLARVLADQLYSELRRLRLGEPGGPPPWLWDARTPLGEAGYSTVDSLDMMSLSVAAAELLPDAGIGPGLMQAATFGDWCDALASCVRRPPAEIAFRSSGSTGAPSRTTHQLALLDDEAAGLALLVGKSRRRVLSAIPANHAYGFIFSVLLPRHLGTPAMVDLRAYAPAELAGLVQPGDLVLGHPLFWTSVLRTLNKPLPADVVGVTSSAPCPDETASGLRQAGLNRLLQVYGASETAGIGWRDDPMAPYTLLRGWRRDGDRLVRGAVKVDAPDLLSWVDGERFHVLGRRDGAVQVGGFNVLPEHVATTLRTHPAVFDVLVRAMRADEGHRLKAFVVPTADAARNESLQDDLRRFATSMLTPAERPGAYRFGPALPRTQLGKPADWSSSSVQD
jgi:long-chain acyl-CoA synthetase